MQKEGPIIFNSEMVRAILDGRKTQTRRIVKNVRPDNCLWLKKPTKIKSGLATHVMDATKLKLCPYGNVGDHLWIRETFQGPLFDEECQRDYFLEPEKYHKAKYCIYRADGSVTPEYRDMDDNLRYGWKPSIHMPRWASRITLKITGVRVEKLNDISLVDTIAEGVIPDHPAVNTSSQEPWFSDFSRSWFAQTWDSIYGKGSWETNPWVWAISFEVLRWKQ